MTASSGGGANSSGANNGHGTTTRACNITQPPTSTVFQQIKQTQASLARLTRVQQQLLSSQSNQTSQQQQNASLSSKATTSATSAKSTTFVDCLIRRFKDCFSEDFCTVPMFVVGNLSPGSDGKHLIFFLTFHNTSFISYQTNKQKPD